MTISYGFCARSVRQIQCGNAYAVKTASPNACRENAKVDERQWKAAAVRVHERGSEHINAIFRDEMPTTSAPQPRPTTKLGDTLKWLAKANDLSTITFTISQTWILHRIQRGRWARCALAGKDPLGPMPAPHISHVHAHCLGGLSARLLFSKTINECDAPRLWTIKIQISLCLSPDTAAGTWRR